MFVFTTRSYVCWKSCLFLVFPCWNFRFSPESLGSVLHEILYWLMLWSWYLSLHLPLHAPFLSITFYPSSVSSQPWRLRLYNIRRGSPIPPLIKSRRNRDRQSRKNARKREPTPISSSRSNNSQRNSKCKISARLPCGRRLRATRSRPLSTNTSKRYWLSYRAIA